jgi:hypothetical protein
VSPELASVSLAGSLHGAPHCDLEPLRIAGLHAGRDPMSIGFLVPELSPSMVITAFAGSLTPRAVRSSCMASGCFRYE